MNESWHIWMSHGTYEWAMSHINESLHIWMEHTCTLLPHLKTHKWVTILHRDELRTLCNNESQTLRKNMVRTLRRNELRTRHRNALRTPNRNEVRTRRKNEPRTLCVNMVQTLRVHMVQTLRPNKQTCTLSIQLKQTLHRNKSRTLHLWSDFAPILCFKCRVCDLSVFRTDCMTNSTRFEVNRTFVRFSIWILVSTILWGSAV